MSRRTPGPQPVLTVATGATVWVGLWAWNGFVETSGDFLLTALLGIVLVGATGVLARAGRLPGVVVVASQLLGVMIFANLAWGSSFFPTPDSLREVVAAFDDAIRTAQQYAAPVPDDAPSLGPLLVLGALLCHVLVDALAVTLGRVPLAGLPLLTVYSLPVSVLERSVSWPVFVVTAIGFLSMLALQEKDRVVRWGRRLGDGSDPSTGRPAQAPVVVVSASAISLALVLPVLIPTLQLSILDAGRSGGGTGGDRQVSITNPMTDLRRDLVATEDYPLVRVRTEDPDPSYLRISVLKEFDGDAWRPGRRRLPENQAAEGELPAPIGLSERVPRSEMPWSLAITEDLDSLWLPTPLYVKDIEAGGDKFRYDAETLDFHTGDDSDSTANQQYSLTALEPDLRPEELADAPPPPVNLEQSYTELPDDFPQSVRDLAAEVTEGLPSDFHRAVALQEYFRDNFTYSTDLVPGNGSDALVEFLFEGEKKGYCEQFASAMAVMARALDIPARVSVGLLDATRIVDRQNEFEFSTRDMHAWTELYFEGFGWVLFEPTPQRRTGGVPSYTRSFGDGSDPSTSATAEPSSRATSTGPAPRPSERTVDPNAEQQSDDDSGVPVALLVGGGGALLLLAGLALVPRALRRRRTALRWRHATDPAEAAWAELRDTAVDLGVPWPTGRSPRAGALVLSQQFAAPRGPESPERPARGPGTNPKAVSAVQSIVAELELSRYAAPGAAGSSGATADQLRAAGETCAEALRAGVSERARRRATWWPRSVLSTKTRTPIARPGGLRPSQGVVDNLG